MNRRRLAWLTLVVLLAAIVACAPRALPDDRLAQAGAARSTAAAGPLGVPAPPSPALPPEAVRPAGTPDLVIIAFSGHCGLVCNTRDTWSYLDSASESTGGVAVLHGIEKAYEALGFENIETFSASSFVTAHYSEISGEVEPGYLQAQAYLDEVKRELIDGYVNPTRVVLVGHSHGTVWASLLAMNNIDVTFDAFVSLDAICWMWWAKHRQFIVETFVNGPWTIPFPLDQGDPCGTLAVPGQSRRANINDVVPANVIFGLEVRTSFRLVSFDPNVLADDDVNVRINGTDRNLWGVVARESHSNLGRYYNQSIGWVASMIQALGVPDHGEYPMETFVLPPPPEGFEYQSGEIVPRSP
ncbi:MAG: hypothetical protein GX560_11075 [Deinococcales bacterium]|nr:hypothetical protein [Deinococcales bacterium]